MMCSRLNWCLVALVTILAGSACGKPDRASSDTAAAEPEPWVRLSWVGTRQIGDDTNVAPALRNIWNLPESTQMREETFEKLSLLPWTLFGTGGDSNGSALLRPLLEDLLREEMRLELGGASNRVDSFVLAVRLNIERFEAWETNLRAVSESLTGAKSSPLPEDHAGWMLTRPEAGGVVVCTRTNEWTVVGAANSLRAVESMTSHLLRSDDRMAVSHTNLWLSLFADLPRLLGNPDSDAYPPCGIPEIQLTLRGEGERVHTEAEFTFPRELGLELASWNVPTNLIKVPFTSFSAVRGVGRILSSWKPWSDLNLGAPPDQAYVWSEPRQPMRTYFALELEDPSRTVELVTKRILEREAEWFGSNDLAGFRRAKRADGLEWNGLPYMWPFLQSAGTNGPGFALGGGFTYSPTGSPLDPSVYRDALHHDNLVYYGWEETGGRIESWLFMGQFVRHVSQRYSQLPAESASLLWLRAISPELGQSTTRVHLNGPDRLKLARNSTLGFTAIELHLLADWLESPQFPRGLNTSHGVPASSGDPAAQP